MDGFGPVILIEGVLFGGGALLFGWWQLRSLKREREETLRRREQEKRAQGTDSPPIGKD